MKLEPYKSGSIKDQLDRVLTPGYEMKWSYVFDTMLVDENDRSTPWSPTAMPRQTLDILHWVIKEMIDG